MSYEELEHTADWAIRVRGSDLAELLRNAVAGMLELAGAELGDDPGRQRAVELDSHDPESLVVDFLTELVVALELRNSGFRELKLQIEDGRRLTGSVREAPLRHIAKPIKAVTYSELSVEHDADGYSATIVFDV